jgi:hypothetical protein
MTVLWLVKRENNSLETFKQRRYILELKLNKLQSLKAEVVCLVGFYGNMCLPLL